MFDTHVVPNQKKAGLKREREKETDEAAGARDQVTLRRD